MNRRYLLSLPLAATLMLPAFAQSGNAVPQNPPAQPAAAPASQSVAPAQAAQTTDKGAPSTANDPNLSAHQPLQPPAREGFWGHLNPFARKKFVQRQLSPVRDRLNELDELSAKNSRDIKDVDSRATEGIRVASAKATEADQHAVDAGNRAQQAQQLAQTTTTKLGAVEQTVSTIDQYQPVSDTEIRFRPGQNVLSKRAKDALDQIAENLKSQRGYIVEVQGFSSGKGAVSVENSRNMAQSVVRYLVINHDIPVYLIHTVGMGNAPIKTADGKTQRIRGGRVEISVMKNGIADLSTQQASAAPMQDNGQPAQQSFSQQTQPMQQSAPQQQPSPATTFGSQAQQPAANTATPAQQPSTPRVPHE